jgi:hypothetical protein
MPIIKCSCGVTNVAVRTGKSSYRTTVSDMHLCKQVQERLAKEGQVTDFECSRMDALVDDARRSGRL